MSLTASFDYHLPSSAIAQRPAEPRDASRLLDARDMSDHRFSELAQLLRPDDLVVVNRTRVRHARLLGAKADTGGGVEMLVLRRLGEDRWRVMIRPARRIRQGMRLVFDGIDGEVLTDPADGVAEVTLVADGDIEAAMERTGLVPLPPYITAHLDDPTRYQTMFADRPGSAAAPTAGLHFTPDLVGSLAAGGIGLTTVELEVGLATFRPITAEKVEDHGMHRERCRIEPEAAQAVADCRERGGRVVAVGTTVVRTLETFRAGGGLVETGERDTDLYLTPGSEVAVVDLLVTNFHLPRSSLLVLLEAFMGRGWRDVYRTALERGYRFLSFGDAMLCGRDGT